MTKVDFYILADQQLEKRLDFACRLVEKAFNSRCQICIQCNDAEQAEAVNKLLWEFKQTSFVPHTLHSEDSQSPVVICTEGQMPNEFDVLVNLADKIPSHFTRFNRVLEIVIQQDHILATTREHYKFYKDRGYALNNIDMRM